LARMLLHFPLMRMKRLVVISTLLFTLTVTAKTSPVSGLGNGWVFSSLKSSRAYLYTPHAMSWAEAEDFCQMVYGHLATDDSEEELRQFLRREKLSGAVWIGLHQSKPQTQFTWTNDFDWSEVSMAPGDGWGEYVEEYEAALCVSLDIDHGFRWDTRYCQGVLVAGTACQIQVPLWVRDGRCKVPEELKNLTLRYYPDQELVQLSSDEMQKTKLCSIEDNFDPILAPTDEQSPQAGFNEKLAGEVVEGAANKIITSLKSESLPEINSSKANNVPAENYTMNLNKSSQPENIKHNDSSQTKDSIVKEKFNKTATLEEKVKLTVKFEVKNNTKLILDNNIPSNNTEAKLVVSTTSDPLLDQKSFKSPHLEIIKSTMETEKPTSIPQILSSTQTVSTRKKVTEIKLLEKSSESEKTSIAMQSRISTEESSTATLIDVTNELQTTPVAPKVSNSSDGVNQNVSNDLKYVSTTENSTVKAEEKESGKEQINTQTTVKSRQKRNAGTRTFNVEQKGNQLLQFSRRNRQQLQESARRAIFRGKEA